MMRRGFCIWALCFLGVVNIFGQSEDCSTEPSLIGGTLPINAVVTPMADDLAMTGMGCDPFDTLNCGFQAGFDYVVCFTPSNSCEVVFQIATGSVQAATHVFTGSCMEPDDCLISGNTDTNIGILLQAGTQYCFVGERCGDATMNMVIGATNNTDCGIFRDPDQPFLFCGNALPAWNVNQFSPCTELDVITVRDLLGFISGDCPCDFPSRDEG